MADYVVRFGAMRFLGVFKAPGGQEYRRGSRVITRTERGLEAAEVLCPANQELIEQLTDLREGQILREITREDEVEIRRLGEQADRELEVCRQYVARLKLPMQLVDVEHIFGGERVVVYYLADGRVDFRELVRQLAGEFQTRIEMRQIGVRDEAKLLADYGDCGLAVCCNNHLVQIPPVSMKMAKLQKATLDPTKISGRCGRLKCCLRYEYESYVQMQEQLPPIGASVNTPEGPGRVVGHEVLVGQLLVQTEDRRRVLVDADQCQVDKPAPRGEAEQPPPRDRADEPAARAQGDQPALRDQAGQAGSRDQ